MGLGKFELVFISYLFSKEEDRKVFTLWPQVLKVNNLSIRIGKIQNITARPTTHILAFAKVVFKYKHVAQKSDAHIGRLLYQRLRPCKDTEG